MKETLWLVFVVYRPDTEAIRTIQNMARVYPTVVVDNSDTKTLPLHLLELTKRRAYIHYIKTNENEGYGGGANVGLRFCFGEGATWGVVFNQDITVTPAAIRSLGAVIGGLPPAVAGPWVGSLDPNRWTTILPATKAYGRYVSGACMAIHRDVVRRIGYFYEPYFLYYEDVDYSVRAKRGGFPMKHVAIAGFTHKVSATTEEESLRTYYLSRNHLLFVKRWAPMWVKLREFVRLPKTMLEHINQGEDQATEGIRDYLLGRFGPKKGSI